MRPLVLRGHRRPLTCVKTNREGDLLFTCGKDASLLLWRTDNGQQIGQYNTGRGAIWACDVTVDSKMLIAATGDARILILDTFTGEMIADIKDEGACKYVEWNRNPQKQDKFVMIHDDFGESVFMALKVYKLDFEQTEEGGLAVEHRILWTQRGYRSRAIQCHWGALDKDVITCHENGTIQVTHALHAGKGAQVWDAENGTNLHVIEAHTQTVTCISFDLYGLFMLSCSSDGTAKLWETLNWTTVKNYKTDRPLNACVISPCFKMDRVEKAHILLGGGQSADEVTTTAASEGKFQALLHHLIHEVEIGSIKGHFGPINTLTFLAEGNGYVSGGEDGNVRIYHFDKDYILDKYD
ncbi:translation initiation factor 3 subunit 2, putative [Babesia bigemina]|uniref:Eukaryotic translation initiation factor 3 subunit I n=1 Tax=Babesia bigemina TaxID=5866 RepID=A0A061D785_BABBI|nr:translation initiation factor 3 subunit 2, putative [Babesia bigemina]CDR94769.1 translation initiation factor 3 subunit 2, putative [Babesia bigemina]|eukprot:XP_012766955.1 translation initiation factor 3 subunit 2, putative [Babesia bigemina]